MRWCVCLVVGSGLFGVLGIIASGVLRLLGSFRFVILWGCAALGRCRRFGCVSSLVGSRWCCGGSVRSRLLSRLLAALLGSRSPSCFFGLSLLLSPRFGSFSRGGAIP